MDLVSQFGTAQTRSKRWFGAVGIVLGVVLLWGGPWILLVVKVAGGFGWWGGKSAMTISEETTHIVEPLDEEGYVDYVAALNAKSRRDVTPENNAVVLLWQAVGPGEILQGDGEEACRQLACELGMSPLSEEGEYFLPLDDYGSELQKAGPPPQTHSSGNQTPGDEAYDREYWWDVLREQFDRASERPWSAEEFPELAAWLERNEAPLGLMVEASWRERYYSPLIRAEHPFWPLNHVVQSRLQCRDACTALAVRAMLHLHEANVDEARQHFAALHRWARLVGQGPFLAEGGVARGIDGMACRGAAAIGHHGNLATDEIRQYRADLDRLGPMPKSVEKLDVAERYLFLDSMITIARGEPCYWDGLGNHRGQLPHEIPHKLHTRAVNWDTVLRMGNGLYDRAVEIGRIADRVERARAILELKKEIKREARADGGLKSLIQSSLIKGPGKAITERTGRGFLSDFVAEISYFFGDESEAAMMLQLADTSLALAAYRAHHGGYPEMLADLVPEYVDEVPRDVFTNDELRYARIDDDYLLYSVGPNGEDEEGRTSDSRPVGDDVVIRTAPVP